MLAYVKSIPNCRCVCFDVFCVVLISNLQIFVYASISLINLSACVNCFANPYNFPPKWQFEIFQGVCLLAVYMFTILHQYDVDGLDFADAVMKAHMLAIASTIGYVAFRLLPAISAGLMFLTKNWCLCFRMLPMVCSKTYCSDE